jgi:hypothetical protein
MDQQTGGADDLPEDIRLMAAHVQAKAARMPGAEELADNIAEALSAPHDDMTPEQIRALAADVIDKSQKVAFLLGKLAALSDTTPAEPCDPPREDS